MIYLSTQLTCNSKDDEKGNNEGDMLLNSGTTLSLSTLGCLFYCSPNPKLPISKHF